MVSVMVTGTAMVMVTVTGTAMAVVMVMAMVTVMAFPLGRWVRPVLAWLCKSLWVLVKGFPLEAVHNLSTEL